MVAIGTIFKGTTVDNLLDLFRLNNSPTMKRTDDKPH